MIITSLSICYMCIRINSSVRKRVWYTSLAAAVRNIVVSSFLCLCLFYIPTMMIFSISDSEVITNSTTTGVEVITSSTSPSNITDEENKSLLNETDDTLELDTSWSTHTTEMPHVLSTTTDLFPKDVKVISITIPGLVITLLVILTILLVLGIFMSQRRKSQNKRLPPENDVEEQCHYSCATANHFHMSANVSYDCVNNHFSSQGCRYVNSSIPEESNIYDTIDTL